MTFGKATHGNHHFYSNFYHKTGLLKNVMRFYVLKILRYFLVLPT